MLGLLRSDPLADHVYSSAAVGLLGKNEAVPGRGETPLSYGCNERQWDDDQGGNKGKQRLLQIESRAAE